MPRFFDDYSNTYLTHDSAAGRKQQRRGWKFRENFKLHYENHVQDWRKGPMGLASAQQAYIRAKGKEDPMIPPLPDGYKEELDEATGITFYYNDETGVRTWVRPGFIPPPPPQAMQNNNNFRSRGPPPQFRGPPAQQFGNRGAPPPPFGAAGGGPPPPRPGQFRGGPPPPPPGQFGAGAPPPPPPNLNAPPPPMPNMAAPPPPPPNMMNAPPPPGPRPPTY